MHEAYYTPTQWSVIVFSLLMIMHFFLYNVTWSVLGPGLFTDYSSPVVSIIKSFDISVHCYADDMQLYAHFIPGENESEVLAHMERCIDII